MNTPKKVLTSPPTWLKDLSCSFISGLVFYFSSFWRDGLGYSLFPPNAPPSSRWMVVDRETGRGNMLVRKLVSES